MAVPERAKTAFSASLASRLNGKSGGQGRRTRNRFSAIDIDTVFWYLLPGHVLFCLHDWPILSICEEMPCGVPFNLSWSRVVPLPVIVCMTSSHSAADMFVSFEVLLCRCLHWIQANK